MAGDGVFEACRERAPHPRPLPRKRGRGELQGFGGGVVLGGGLLGTAVLQSAVRERIAGSWPAAPITTCGSGVGGAVWLAARGLGVELPGGLHTALTSAR